MLLYLLNSFHPYDTAPPFLSELTFLLATLPRSPILSGLTFLIQYLVLFLVYTVFFLLHWVQTLNMAILLHLMC